MLKHLLERGQESPKVLAATHFYDVFREDLFDPSVVSISFRHMQVMFTSTNGSILESNDPTDITEGDEVPGTEHGSVRKVGIGEKITYLYR